MLGLVSFFVNSVSHNDAKYYANLRSSRMQLCARRIALVTRRIHHPQRLRMRGIQLRRRPSIKLVGQLLQRIHNTSLVIRRLF